MMLYIENKNYWKELDWSLSWVSGRLFETDSTRSRVAHIFNSIQVELSIFSTRLNSTRVEIESTRLDLSRTRTWRQDAKNINIEQYFRLFFCNKLHYLCALSLRIIFASLNFAFAHLRISHCALPLCITFVFRICAFRICASAYFTLCITFVHYLCISHLRICVFHIVHYLCALSLYFAFAHLHILHCAVSLCIIFARKTRENTIYLSLSNYLSSRIEFLSRVVEFSFTTRFEFSISTFQLDSTWVTKFRNSIRRDQSKKNAKILKNTAKIAFT
jgi:hypothetical protein